MNIHARLLLLLLLAAIAAPALGADVDAAPPTPKGLTGFADIQRWYSARRKEFNEGQARLLQKRYDLSDKAAADGAMFRGKKIQQGVRAKLPAGVTWEDLAKMTPEEIRRRDAFPEGFMPLPHPNHPEGGMLFPRMHIEEIKKQEGRDLERFDLDFDLPEHFLPEFPPAMFLTTRPDLGDVSKGRLVTLDNYYELFDGVLNPKQLDGLRLLLTPFPQQQFNATDDRRVRRPSLGVTCFDCHANGGTNGATHLVGDIRPQEFRHRIETPALRGVNVQRLFGSQRALKSVEDFTEFEQRAAYFDGDITLAAKKGVHVPDRQSQVHHMAELQNLLNFPPAPKLGVNGRLIEAKASPAELRGQALFFGKAKCADCHAPPYYTDNTMHDLKAERFYKPRSSRGMMMSADGPIKNFPLRGIKDTPPYLHDGRLLTLDDTVRFFNLVLETKLTPEEEADVTAFMKAL
ncbi:MAG: cytochrome B6 [Elusimicrobiota bacterium]|nr:cytochrome B6 [Elusimicrobiota bacterium]